MACLVQGAVHFSLMDGRRWPKQMPNLLVRLQAADWHLPDCYIWALFLLLRPEAAQFRDQLGGSQPTAAAKIAASELRSSPKIGAGGQLAVQGLVRQLTLLNGGIGKAVPSNRYCQRSAYPEVNSILQYLST